MPLVLFIFFFASKRADLRIVNCFAMKVNLLSLLGNS